MSSVKKGGVAGGGRKGKKQSRQRDPWGRREKRTSENGQWTRAVCPFIKWRWERGAHVGGPRPKPDLGSRYLPDLSSSPPRSLELPGRRC